MAPHDHLLDNFAASKETRQHAAELLRQAKLKTGRGSGRELGEFTTGLAAVCMLLASERLNTGEISLNSAQVASCLKKKDFKKVYDLVKAAVEEAEEEESTYGSLHEKYKSGALDNALHPFFTEIENALITLATGYGHKTVMFKSVVYFWVCGAAKLKTLPGTEVFASNHRLPVKKFINILNLLNQHCLALRKTIQTTFKPKPKSPVKGPMIASTPRQSPRKTTAIQENQTKGTPTRSETTTEESEQQTPRRSQRNALLQESTSPTKRPSRPSPSKIAQPLPLRLFQKGPMRELPSKDSPKKRPVENLQPHDHPDQMEVDTPAIESPVKRRRLESPSKPTTRSASASASSSNVEAEALASPTKKKSTEIHPSLALARSSPLKQSRTDDRNAQESLIEAASSSDESEPTFTFRTRRFRPVYLDHKQWNARDPRLNRIWKRADKRQKSALRVEA